MSDVTYYSYDRIGRLEDANNPQTRHVSYEYDLGDRLTKLTNNLDGTSLVYSYDNYDKVGNCLSLGINDSNSFVFGYDEIYRLIFVDYNDGLNWSDFYYDRLGNRQKVADSGASTYYLSNSLNQYTSVGGIAYTYDDNGNLANDGVYKYYYDCRNRLVDVNNQADNPVASYEYYYAGRRISKTVDSNTVEYVYDGQQIIAEYEDGVLARKFVYGAGIDEPLVMISVDGETETSYYYHFDGLGSVVALSDVNNSVVEQYSYDVFGDADELIGTLVWLVSDASKFVTGIVVPVDGGFSAFSGV